MMEVEEVHGFRDADMMPEETSVAWDDQMMMQDDHHHHHHEPILEVEMANEFPDDDIEYDMEDASGHLEIPDEPVILPTEVVQLADQIQPQTIPLIIPLSSSTPPLPPPPPVSSDSVSNGNIPESNPPEQLSLGSSTEALAGGVESDTPQATDGRPDNASVDASLANESALPNGNASPPKTALVGGLDSPQVEPRVEGELDRSEPHEAVVNSDVAQEITEEATDPLAEPNTESLETVDESATELYPSSVLVTSPSSSTLPPFYLFAPPDDSSSEEVVYFTDQAQLFYEPLSAVFEALRALADDLGIADHVELALCSEALDLNVSEDNVFSREVSLNDLNTLHIGCELEGSLALRLDQNTPRFITRYRAIMAELHRVSSVQDAGQSTDAEDLPVPSDGEQGADQTGQEGQGGKDDNNEDPAAEAGLQNNGADEDDQTSGDPAPSALSAIAEAITRPQSHLTGDATNERGASPERPSPQASTKTPFNTIGATSLTKERDYARPAQDSKEDGEINQLTARDVPKSPEVASATTSTGNLENTTAVGHHPKEVATNSKRAGDIDSPPAVASEGIPLYRVTFDVSDQEEGEAGDTTSLIGDETQTTRFESQMTGPSFMFNTQDGVDVPYHPDMYLNDNDDDADAYAADLERGYAPPPPSKPFESSGDYTRTDLGEYDQDAQPSSIAFKSPASELWDDEPDELLFYEVEDGEPNDVERAGSEEGENSQEPKDPQEHDQYTEHDEVVISYEDDVIDPATETVPVLTSRTELPPVETKPSSPIRSWSTHSSKRSFNDDDTENGVDYLGRKAEAKRAKIQ